MCNCKGGSYNLMAKGRVVSINISGKKGEKKIPTGEVFLDKYGIKGDGHSGNWHRQVSLLSIESIKKIQKEGVNADPGDFAENLTTEGIQLNKLKIGDILIVGEDRDLLIDRKVGSSRLYNCQRKTTLEKLVVEKDDFKNGVILEVTQIGKECTHPCKIYYLVGYCIMPKEGIFCRVIKMGNIKNGQSILVFRKEKN